MRLTVIAIVLVGSFFAFVLGLQEGFTAEGVAILVVTVAVGLLAIAVVSRSRTGSAQPGRCPECEGVISPNAPYCKHCGARLLSEAGPV